MKAPEAPNPKRQIPNARCNPKRNPRMSRTGRITRRKPQIARKKTDYTEAEAPSNKSQTPNKRQAPNNKFKTPVRDIAPFEFVVLSFVRL
jgi:hypothetical protein